MQLWIWILIIIAILFGVIPVFLLPFILYMILLVRTSPKKWGRECSIPDDKEYKRMFDIGMEWHDTYRQFKQPVEIKSDGLRLVGEYFDFGGKTSVIIISGRMESLLYSYYFAEPYRKLGFNVLVIDNRAHGLSDGRVVSFGVKEYRDILNWGKLLRDRFEQESVVLHGICIGCSVALYTLTAPDCPDYMKAMVAEGMYATFNESFIQHLIEKKKPIRPTAALFSLYIRLFSGVDVIHDGPIKRIEQLKKPILFLHSHKDFYSLPERAEVLYQKCSAPKRIVWFNKGIHSRIRVNNTERYDQAILDFYRQGGPAV